MSTLKTTIIGTHNRVDEKGKLYTVYIIAVEGRGPPWCVGRRFNEFYLLDNQVKKRLPPGITLPPLPPRNVGNKLDPMVVSERLSGLQFYLSSLVSMEAVRVMPVFRRFLEEGRRLITDHDGSEPEVYPSQKKQYLDVIIVQAENVPALPEQRSLLDYFRGKSHERATCVQVSVGEQEYTTNPVYDDADPVWNENCTFTFQNPDELLIIRVLDRISGTDVELGVAKVNLNEIPSKQIFDWRPKLTVEGCHVHLILHKVNAPRDGMLAYLGRPLECIPLRMDVGDVILMNSSMLLTHGTKLATWSQWDHVAMVASLPGKSRLRLFEATIDGVDASCSLEKALAGYREVSKLGVRRLQCARTRDMIAALQEFIQEVQGRPYKKDLVQLVRAWAGRNQENDMRSFFCSQLIAAAYQRMGILSDVVVAQNFLPVDFASDLKGRLLYPAKLGPILIFPMLDSGVSFPTRVEVPVGIRALMVSGTYAANPEPIKWPEPRDWTPALRGSTSGSSPVDPSALCAGGSVGRLSAHRANEKDAPAPPAADATEVVAEKKQKHKKKHRRKQRAEAAVAAGEAEDLRVDAEAEAQVLPPPDSPESPRPGSNINLGPIVEHGASSSPLEHSGTWANCKSPWLADGPAPALSVVAGAARATIPGVPVPREREPMAWATSPPPPAHFVTSPPTPRAPPQQKMGVGRARSPRSSLPGELVAASSSPPPPSSSPSSCSYSSSSSSSSSSSCSPSSSPCPSPTKFLPISVSPREPSRSAPVSTLSSPTSKMCSTIVSPRMLRRTAPESREANASPTRSFMAQHRAVSPPFSLPVDDLLSPSPPASSSLSPRLPLSDPSVSAASSPPAAATEPLVLYSPSAALAPGAVAH